ncbi:glycoside hydrolase family 65 protein [Bailinhaonella thermotolerans]|uniref:Glycoside hydrolase family 65 protein n=1 Tax=Bailinhaonella thermotolerans TaxID=1070861 RepID=A0A3A4AXA1_9ACTN|nr:glycosyl hydrolase family 65 protein [Bailinhaonella thermotolerans]RJL34605.1 glycoside hydrolase family 65 protein [Bailinhaonella thermotolerans]
MRDWSLTFEGFDPGGERLREALCTLGNGFFATRGAAPEAVAGECHYPGTYVAGVYDRLASEVAGHRVVNEDIVNVPNWLPLTFRAAGGPWFDAAELPGEGVTGYRQELDLRHGVLVREFTRRDGQGRATSVRQRRLVSMDDPHLAALETVLTPVNWSGVLEVRSLLDASVRNEGVARYRDLRGDHLAPLGSGVDGPVAWVRVATAASGVHVAEAARTGVRLPGSGDAPPPAYTPIEDAVRPGVAVAVPVERGTACAVEKVVALATSRDHGIGECAEHTREAVRAAPGFGDLLARHAAAWRRLWRRARLETGTPDDETILRLHAFHLLQTLSPHTADLDAGVPARGLHGEAYRGHVFWDELFVLPWLNLRFPEIARALIRYRHRRLPKARAAAREEGLPGAMFPWQSGSDGREETQRLHLNPRSGRWLPDHSRLQRHVGLAVAYNVWQHYQATGDVDMLGETGAELMVEVARFFAGLARFDEGLGRYVIRGVMGPDEYHDAYPGADRPGLDENAYTNVMTVWALARALDALEALPPPRRDELAERLELGAEEPERWADLTRRMRVVWHADGVISQFDGYESLAELDWEGYRRRYGDIRRLDRILEAEGDTPNRYKLSKQADVLMLFYLLSAEELAEIFHRLGYPFEGATIPRTIRYYLARTSHGSTLSAVVHAWVLARGDRRASWRFFTEALAGDVHDVQGGTAAEGVHLGAMGGTLDLAQRCYLGLETRGNALRLNPALPDALPRLSLDLRYRGCDLSIDADHAELRLRVSYGRQPIRVVAGDREAALVPGKTYVFPLDGRP